MHDQVMVIGGGTMGQGIALAGALAGHPTTLVDLPEALPRVRAGVEKFLADRVKRGKLSEAGLREARKAIRIEEGLEAARSARWIFEAIVESLEPKRKLLADLERLAPPCALLCTNTSSLSVTAMAAGLRRPASVLGLHFFNPATVMPLVEIVRTCWTEQATIDAAVAFVKGLGKTPVVVKDTPGFVVNRVARPFPVEALRIVSEGTASPRQVDRILKLGAGFKMGPFELMDLVGIDVNFAVTQSVFRSFFEEPRFRPVLLQQELVNAGRLGRKTGHGVYRYDGAAGEEAGSAGAAPDGAPPVEAVRGTDVAFVDAAPGAEALVSRLVPREARRWDPERVLREGALDPGAKLVLVFARGARGEQERWLAALGGNAGPGATIALHAPRLSVSELAMAYARPERVVGFGYLAETAAPATLVEVAPGLRTAADALATVERFLAGRGLETERVADFSGLVLRRVLYAIVNEAAFALWEGVASREDIDLGMKLGTNYPAGPLAWADAIGLDQVHDGLAALQEEMGEDRYRPCPLLRKLVAAGFTGKRAGRGFFEYPEQAERTR